jgi:uncharacterized membrane protein
MRITHKRADATTRGLDTAKLKRKKQLNPTLILAILFFIVAGLYLSVDQKEPDTTYKTPSELFVEHESAATIKLLKQEKETTQQKARKAQFQWINNEK